MVPPAAGMAPAPTAPSRPRRGPRPSWSQTADHCPGHRRPVGTPSTEVQGAGQEEAGGWAAAGGVKDRLLGELSLIAPAASLYTSSTQRSRSNSFGERLSGGGARRVRALVSHSEGANHTLLRFSAGDVVEVLVPEARNGWLYGKLEGSSA